MSVVSHPVRQFARRIARNRLSNASILLVLLRSFGTAAAITVLAASLLLSLVPRVLGGDTLTVLSGSMEPTFSAGDAVAVRGVEPDHVCANVGVGDVITFFPESNDPSLITHRVIGKTLGSFDGVTSCRLVTQGDANTTVDAPVSPEQVRGVVMFRVPYLGAAREWAVQNPLPLAAAAGAVLLIYCALIVLRPSRARTFVSVQPPAVVHPAPGGAGDQSAYDKRGSELPLSKGSSREREVDRFERELHSSRNSELPQFSSKEGNSQS